jgi:hypothetical protein
VAAVFGGARKVNEVLRALAEVIHGQGQVGNRAAARNR